MCKDLLSHDEYSTLSLIGFTEAQEEEDKRYGIMNKIYLITLS